MRVSTGSNVSSAPCIEQSAMISERGRGRDHEDEDVNSLELDVDLMEVGIVLLRKAPGNVGIVNIITTSPKVLGEIWTT